MANFGQLLLTNLGIQEQYKAQGGSELKFKRIAMGSGKFTGNIMALKGLVAENVSVDISKGYMQNNTYIVEGFFSNEGLNTGFAWREIGLFVEDANGNEVLYCYANAGDSYDYIPATADEHYSKYIRIATIVGNATNISIVESEGILRVDLQTFNAAVEEFRTDIYALWPSKSAEGNPIVLKDAASLPFLGMKIQGNTKQISTEGKNLHPLFPESSMNGVQLTHTGDGGICLSGTATGGAFSAVINFSLPAGRYIFSANNAVGIGTGTSDAPYIALRDADMNWLMTRTFTQPHVAQTFSNPAEITSILLAVPEGVKVNNFTLYPQVEIGSVATDFEMFTGGAPSPSPTYPQEIVSIGDDGSIDVEVYGKNLLNITTSGKVVEVTETVSEDGLVSFSGTATGSGGRTAWFRSDIITLLPGRYTLSMNVPSGNAPLPYLTKYGTSQAVASVGTFTITETTNVYLGFNYDAGVEYNAQNVSIQLEVGDAATEHERYKAKQTIAITSPGGLAGLPVNYGGNYTDENGQQWILDEVDLERCVYKQWLYEEILDGTQSISNYRPEDNTDTYFGFSIGLKKEVNANRAGRTTFLVFGNATTNGYHPNTFVVGYQGLYMRVVIDGVTSVETFKEWLTANPQKVLYALAEPIETYLSDEEIAYYQALSTNNPNTTIINTDGARMSVEYITKAHESIFNKVLDRAAAYTDAATAGTASVMSLTSAEYNAMEKKSANTIYQITDEEEEEETGGVNSWNDLEDRPFYEETVTGEVVIEYDGDSTGKVVIPMGEDVQMVKVSDLTPEPSELIGGTATVGEDSVTITEDMVMDVRSQGLPAAVVIHETVGELFCIFYSPFADAGITETGIYFVDMGVAASLKYTGTATNIKKLDPKFLEFSKVSDTALVDETVNISGSGEFTNAFAMVAGETYSIEFDGVRYSCVAKLFVGDDVITYVGNGGVLGLEASEEPFIVACFSGRSIVATSNADGEYSIKIYHVECVKIPKECLPEDIGGDCGLPEVTTDDNGKVLIVSDGAWATGDLPQIPEIPEATADDNGKFLQVVDGAYTLVALKIYDGEVR